LRNNGYLELNFNSTYQELISSSIISPLDRHKQCFYINDLKLFFKEENERIYYELIGSKIASILGINHVDYDMIKIKTNDKTFNGVVSKDYREEGYNLIYIDEVLKTYQRDHDINDNYFNEMNLDHIQKALYYYFSNYKDKDMITSSIVNEIIAYYMFDLLLGNIDNGRYNYEIMVSSDTAKNSPYCDFGLTFNFNSTMLTVKKDTGNDIYDNIKLLLEEYPEVYEKFLYMYNKLTPSALEEIFKLVKEDIKTTIPNNIKNILFLSYSSHYEKIGKILNKKKVL